MVTKNSFKDNFFFDEQFIVRMPLLHYSLSKLKISDIKQILELWPEIKMAIAHASSEFSSSINSTDELNEKQQLTLLKYIRRLSSRPMPFGLFAGIGIGSWTRNAEHMANLRYENWTVVSFTEREMNKNQNFILTNPTLYFKSNNIFYYDLRPNLKNEISANFMQFENNEVLQNLLNAATYGCEMKNLIVFLLNAGFSKNESDHFLKELISTGILVRPSHYSNFINPENILKVTKSIKAFKSEDLQINSTIVYDKKIVLNKEIINRLYKVMDIYNKLTSIESNSSLKEFYNEFVNRYGEHSVQLLEVINPITGINYKSNLTKKIELDEIQSFLMKKISTALVTGMNEIEILDDEMLSFDADFSAFPPTFSCLFSVLTNEAGELEHILHGAGDTNAINLFARFSPFSADLQKICEDTILHEKVDDNVIYFSVDHYENEKFKIISYNSFVPDYCCSTQNNNLVYKSEYIPLNDIHVCINHRMERIELISKTRQKRLIPRFYSAFVPQKNSLPLIRLLYDLQVDNQKKNFCFVKLGDWQYNLTYIPKIRYKSFILRPASWILNEKQICEISESKNNSDLEMVLRKYRMPNVVNVLDSDQELLINFSNDYLILKELLKNKKKVLFTENYVNHENSIIKNIKGNSYAHEFVAIIKKKTLLSQEMINNQLCINAFEPNDWLSFKWYANCRVQNELLFVYLKDFLIKLKNENLNFNFFFIRYKDNYDHLRIRFKLNKRNDESKLIKDFLLLSKSLVLNGLIWEVVQTTYCQEKNRYKNIDLAEQIFENDSFATLNLPLTYPLDEFILFAQAVSIINFYFNLFSFDINEKIKFVDFMLEHFENEFPLDKLKKKEIGVLYRKIEGLIDDEYKHFPFDMKDYEYGIENYGFVSSIIHMSMNRLFVENQRYNEYMSYQFSIRFFRRIKFHVTSNQKTS